MHNLNKTVFISIITRNQSKFLTNYLRCIDELEYDKKLITILIKNKIINSINISAETAADELGSILAKKINTIAMKFMEGCLPITTNVQGLAKCGYSVFRQPGSLMY